EYLSPAEQDCIYVVPFPRRFTGNDTEAFTPV
ncbi:hypothetical protein M514_11765, partial [Trichuris suis]